MKHQLVILFIFLIVPILFWSQTAIGDPGSATAANQTVIDAATRVGTAEAEFAAAKKHAEKNPNDEDAKKALEKATLSLKAAKENLASAKAAQASTQAGGCSGGGEGEGGGGGQPPPPQKPEDKKKEDSKEESKKEPQQQTQSTGDTQTKTEAPPQKKDEGKSDELLKQLADMNQSPNSAEATKTSKARTAETDAAIQKMAEANNTQVTNLLKLGTWQSTPAKAPN